MSYTVIAASGARRTGLASSTACLLINGTLASQIADFDHATVSGSTFSFIQPGDTVVRRTLTLTVHTLASAAVGSLVWLDDGSGTSTWRAATVANDGSSAQAPDGSSIASTAQACALLAENNQVLPSPGTKLMLVATASDGKVYFRSTTPAGLVICSSMSTVGSLSGAAIVQVGTSWVAMEV